MWRLSRASNSLVFTRSLNTSAIAKKSQLRLYPLRRLRKGHLPPPICTTFYRGIVEGILSSCITVWLGNCIASDQKTLQHTVSTAEKIISVFCPSLKNILNNCCIHEALSIAEDPSHPSHGLFTLQRRYQSQPTNTTNLCNSFIPQAITLPNSYLI